MRESSPMLPFITSLRIAEYEVAILKIHFLKLNFTLSKFANSNCKLGPG